MHWILFSCFFRVEIWLQTPNQLIYTRGIKLCPAVSYFALIYQKSIQSKKKEKLNENSHENVLDTSQDLDVGVVLTS